MANTGSSLLPTPIAWGWAAAMPHPDSSVLLGIGLTDAEVSPITDLEEAERQMREAVAVLAGSRPGGEHWAAAERSDVVAVRSGRPATALAKLVGGDVQRWAEATARANLVGDLTAAFAAKGGVSATVETLGRQRRCRADVGGDEGDRADRRRGLAATG